MSRHKTCAYISDSQDEYDADICLYTCEVDTLGHKDRHRPMPQWLKLWIEYTHCCYSHERRLLFIEFLKCIVPRLQSDLEDMRDALTLYCDEILSHAVSITIRDVSELTRKLLVDGGDDDVVTSIIHYISTDDVGHNATLAMSLLLDHCIRGDSVRGLVELVTSVLQVVTESDTTESRTVAHSMVDLLTQIFRITTVDHYDELLLKHCDLETKYAIKTAMYGVMPDVPSTSNTCLYSLMKYGSYVFINLQSSSVDGEDARNSALQYLLCLKTMLLNTCGRADKRLLVFRALVNAGFVRHVLYCCSRSPCDDGQEVLVRSMELMLVMLGVSCGVTDLIEIEFTKSNGYVCLIDAVIWLKSKGLLGHSSRAVAYVRDLVFISHSKFKNNTPVINSETDIAWEEYDPEEDGDDSKRQAILRLTVDAVQVLDSEPELRFVDKRACNLDAFQVLLRYFEACYSEFAFLSIALDAVSYVLLADAHNYRVLSCTMPFTYLWHSDRFHAFPVYLRSRILLKFRALVISSPDGPLYMHDPPVQEDLRDWSLLVKLLQTTPSLTTTLLMTHHLSYLLKTHPAVNKALSEVDLVTIVVKYVALAAELAKYSNVFSDEYCLEWTSLLGSCSRNPELVKESLAGHLKDELWGAWYDSITEDDLRDAELLSSLLMTRDATAGPEEADRLFERMHNDDNSASGHSICAMNESRSVLWNRIKPMLFHMSKEWLMMTSSFLASDAENAPKFIQGGGLDRLMSLLHDADLRQPTFNVISVLIGYTLQEAKVVIEALYKELSPCLKDAFNMVMQQQQVAHSAHNSLAVETGLKPLNHVIMLLIDFLQFATGIMENNIYFRSAFSDKFLDWLMELVSSCFIMTTPYLNVNDVSCSQLCMPSDDGSSRALQARNHALVMPLILELMHTISCTMDQPMPPLVGDDIAMQKTLFIKLRSKSVDFRSLITPILSSQILYTSYAMPLIRSLLSVGTGGVWPYYCQSHDWSEVSLHQHTCASKQTCGRDCTYYCTCGSCEELNPLKNSYGDPGIMIHGVCQYICDRAVCVHKASECNLCMSRTIVRHCSIVETLLSTVGVCVTEYLKFSLPEKQREDLMCYIGNRRESDNVDLLGKRVTSEARLPSWLWSNSLVYLNEIGSKIGQPVLDKDSMNNVSISASFMLRNLLWLIAVNHSTCVSLNSQIPMFQMICRMFSSVILPPGSILHHDLVKDVRPLCLSMLETVGSFSITSHDVHSLFRALLEDMPLPRNYLRNIMTLWEPDQHEYQRQLSYWSDQKRRQSPIEKVAIINMLCRISSIRGRRPTYTMRFRHAISGRGHIDGDILSAGLKFEKAWFNTGGYTMSTWLRVASSPSEIVDPIPLMALEIEGKRGVVLDMMYRPHEKRFALCVTDSDGSNHACTLEYPVNTGRWYHVAIAHKRGRFGKQGKVSLYLDGYYACSAELLFPSACSGSFRFMTRMSLPSSILNSLDDDEVVMPAHTHAVPHQDLLGAMADEIDAPDDVTAVIQHERGNVYFLDDVIDDSSIFLLFRLGPDYGELFGQVDSDRLISECDYMSMDPTRHPSTVPTTISRHANSLLAMLKQRFVFLVHAKSKSLIADLQSSARMPGLDEYASTSPDVDGTQRTVVSAVSLQRMTLMGNLDHPPASPWVMASDVTGNDEIGAKIDDESHVMDDRDAHLACSPDHVTYYTSHGLADSLSSAGGVCLVLTAMSFALEGKLQTSCLRLMGHMLWSGLDAIVSQMKDIKGFELIGQLMRSKKWEKSAETFKAMMAIICSTYQLIQSKSNEYFMGDLGFMSMWPAPVTPECGCTVNCAYHKVWLMDLKSTPCVLALMPAVRHWLLDWRIWLLHTSPNMQLYVFHTFSSLMTLHHTDGVTSPGEVPWIPGAAQGMDSGSLSAIVGVNTMRFKESSALSVILHTCIEYGGRFHVSVVPYVISIVRQLVDDASPSDIEQIWSYLVSTHPKTPTPLASWALPLSLSPKKRRDGMKSKDDEFWATHWASDVDGPSQRKTAHRKLFDDLNTITDSTPITASSSSPAPETDDDAISPSRITAREYGYTYALNVDKDSDPYTLDSGYDDTPMSPEMDSEPSMVMDENETSQVKPTRMSIGQRQTLRSVLVDIMNESTDSDTRTGDQPARSPLHTVEMSSADVVPEILRVGLFEVFLDSLISGGDVLLEEFSKNQYRMDTLVCLTRHSCPPIPVLCCMVLAHCLSNHKLSQLFIEHDLGSLLLGQLDPADSLKHTLTGDLISAMLSLCYGHKFLIEPSQDWMFVEIAKRMGCAFTATSEISPGWTAPRDTLELSTICDVSNNGTPLRHMPKHYSVMPPENILEILLRDSRWRHARNAMDLKAAANRKGAVLMYLPCIKILCRMAGWCCRVEPDDSGGALEIRFVVLRRLITSILWCLFEHKMPPTPVDALDQGMIRFAPIPPLTPFRDMLLDAAELDDGLCHVLIDDMRNASVSCTAVANRNGGDSSKQSPDVNYNKRRFLFSPGLHNQNLLQPSTPIPAKKHYSNETNEYARYPTSLLIAGDLAMFLLQRCVIYRMQMAKGWEGIMNTLDTLQYYAYGRISPSSLVYLKRWLLWGVLAYFRAHLMDAAVGSNEAVVTNLARVCGITIDELFSWHLAAQCVQIRLSPSDLPTVGLHLPSDVPSDTQSGDSAIKYLTREPNIINPEAPLHEARISLTVGVPYETSHWALPPSHGAFLGHVFDMLTKSRRSLESESRTSSFEFMPLLAMQRTLYDHYARFISLVLDKDLRLPSPEGIGLASSLFSTLATWPDTYLGSHMESQSFLAVLLGACWDFISNEEDAGTGEGGHRDTEISEMSEYAWEVWIYVLSYASKFRRPTGKSKSNDNVPPTVLNTILESGVGALLDEGLLNLEQDNESLGDINGPGSSPASAKKSKKSKSKSKHNPEKVRQMLKNLRFRMSVEDIATVISHNHYLEAAHTNARKERMSAERYAAIVNLALSKRINVDAKAYSDINTRAVSVTNEFFNTTSAEYKHAYSFITRLQQLNNRCCEMWEDLIEMMLIGTFGIQPTDGCWRLDYTEGPDRMRKRLCYARIPISFSPKPRKIGDGSEEANNSDDMDSLTATTPKSLGLLLSDSSADHTSEYNRQMYFSEVDDDVSYDRLLGGSMFLLGDVSSSNEQPTIQPCRRVTPMYECQGELVIASGKVLFYGERFFTKLGRPDQPPPFPTPALRISFPADAIRMIMKRRYILRDNSLELFLSSGRNLLFSFNSTGNRDSVLNALKDIGLSNLVNYEEEVTGKTLWSKSLTQRWQRGDVTNFQYLMHLNTLAGRTYNDFMQYPVFPWILTDYLSSKLNIDDTIETNTNSTSAESSTVTSSQFRDLSVPMGAYDQKRFERFDDFFRDFGYFYRTHYSNVGIVLYFSLRLPPYNWHHVEFQSGRFDLPDRLFHSIATSWALASSKSDSDVKELIPELFYLPDVLVNRNGLPLGKKHDGTPVDNVILPPWCNGDPRMFVAMHRRALESPAVSRNLHKWIDMVFGYLQLGPGSVTARNVFNPATYEEKCDMDSPEAGAFGQTPKQLFKKPHPARLKVSLEVPMTIRSAPERLKTSDVRSFGEPIGVLEIPGDLSSMAITGTRKQIVRMPYVLSWGHWDDQIRIINVDAGRAVACWNLTSAMSFCDTMTCVKLDLSQRKLVIGYSSGTVRIWNVQSNKIKKSDMEAVGGMGPIEATTATDIASPIQSDDLYYRASDVRVNNLNNEQVPLENKMAVADAINVNRAVLELMPTPLSLHSWLHCHVGYITNIEMSSTWGVCVTGGSDGTVCIWDTVKWKRICTMNAGAGPVTALGVVSGGGDIITACSESAVCVDRSWSTDKYVEIDSNLVIKNPGCPYPRTCIRLWDINGRLIETAYIKSVIVSSLYITKAPEGIERNVVFLGTNVGSVIALDVFSLNHICTLSAASMNTGGVSKDQQGSTKISKDQEPYAITSIASTNDEKSLVIGTSNGKVISWELVH